MEDFITGTVAPFPYNFVPRGWMPCDGRALSIPQYTALYSLIGTTYGGDDKTIFNLPSLNAANGQPARIVAGEGAGPGLSPRRMGEKVGSDTVTLTSEQIPPHSHGFALYTSGANPTTVPATGDTVAIGDSNGFVAPPIKSPTTFAPQAIEAAGGGQPHANDQPVLELIYCICVDGEYPQFS